MTQGGRPGLRGGAPHDLTGRAFGALVAVRLVGVVDGRARWLCSCECGGEIVTMAQTLKRGGATTCKAATHRRARMLGKGVTHGASGTREHEIWAGMRQRCRSHPRYAGRGVKVCERWASFENFLADMGLSPDGYEIERIDNDGDYCPDNCRWATVGDQANNKRTNRMVGDLTIAQYAKLEGLKYATAYYRKVIVGRALHRSEVSGGRA